jgi:hypothetical protein
MKIINQRNEKQYNKQFETWPLCIGLFIFFDFIIIPDWQEQQHVW